MQASNCRLPHICILVDANQSAKVTSVRARLVVALAHVLERLRKQVCDPVQDLLERHTLVRLGGLSSASGAVDVGARDSSRGSAGRLGSRRKSGGKVGDER